MHHRMNQDLLKNVNREQILATAAKTFEERVPFNRSLGFEFELPKDGTAKLSFEMRDDLVGNFMRDMLHLSLIHI